MNIWEEIYTRFEVRRFLNESSITKINLSEKDFDFIWEAISQFLQQTKNLKGSRKIGNTNIEQVVDKIEAHGDNSKFTEDELRAIHFVLTSYQESKKSPEETRKATELKKRIRMSFIGKFESMGSGNSTSGGESGSPEETEVEETY